MIRDVILVGGSSFVVVELARTLCTVLLVEML